MYGTRPHGCDTDHAPSGCDSESIMRIKFRPMRGLIKWTQTLDSYRGLILWTHIEHHAGPVAAHTQSPGGRAAPPLGGGACPRPHTDGGQHGPIELSYRSHRDELTWRARHNTLTRISPMVRGRSSKMARVLCACGAVGWGCDPTVVSRSDGA